MKTVCTYHKKNRSCDGLSVKKLTVTPDLGIGDYPCQPNGTIEQVSQNMCQQKIGIYRTMGLYKVN